MMQNTHWLESCLTDKLCKIIVNNKKPAFFVNHLIIFSFPLFYSPHLLATRIAHIVTDFS